MPPSYIDEATGRKREDSTISYEVTFKPLIKGDKPEERIYLPFTGLKATYRGRDREDAPPINLANIRRFSLMVRRWALLQQQEREEGLIRGKQLFW